MDDRTYLAFIDEMSKIAEAEGMDKEALIQHLYGAGKALGAMGRAGYGMLHSGLRAGAKSFGAGEGLGTALQRGWQHAGGGAKGPGVFQQMGTMAQKGWKRGTSAMEQAAAGQQGWLNRQRAMAGSFVPKTPTASTNVGAGA